MPKLTAKQELFAQGLMKGLGQREAYRLAGYKVDDSKGRKPMYDVEASRLARNPNIALRLDEMEQAAKVSESVTVQTVTNMLALVFEDGRKYKQIGACATAAMGIAKLHGLLIDRTEDITRKPTRNPDAPLEIEVEHWLTEHRLISPAQEPLAGVAQEPEMTQPDTSGEPVTEPLPEPVTEPLPEPEPDLDAEAKALFG